MSMVKLLAILTIVSLTPVFASSQLKMPFSNPLQGDVEKIIRQYPQQFQDIIGEEISETPQTVDYLSGMSINGAEQCTITRYSSRKKPVYSWQAVMLTTEDFELAKKKFKSLFSQLNNLTVKLGAQENLQFRGSYDAPSEEKKFTSAILSNESRSGSWKNLKLELVMELHMMEWKVRILLYEREREDDEKGQSTN
jgi:hypothetical protein